MEESRATESRPAPPPLPCNGAADGSDAPLVATGTNDSISDIDPTSVPADVIVDSNVTAKGTEVDKQVASISFHSPANANSGVRELKLQFGKYSKKYCSLLF